MLKSTMLLMLGLWAGVVMAEDLGQLSSNPYGPNSTSNPYSPAGSPYSSTSVKNPNGQYGSPYSNQSATNPYATDAPKLYDAQGEYRGKLSSNPYDPESVSNPYGRYGSRYSSESINRDAAHSLLRCGPAGTSVCRRSRGLADIQSASVSTRAHPYGAGSKYRSDSPTNPYGTGWTIKSGDDSPPKSPSYTPSVPAYAPAVPSYSRPSSSIAPDYAYPSSSGYHKPSYGLQPTAADPWEVLRDPEGDESEDADDLWGE